MKIVTNYILLSLLVACTIIGCKGEDGADVQNHIYSIETQDSVRGRLKTDTFRIEKYKIPAGKKIRVTATFKSTSTDKFPSQFIEEGEILYVLFQTKGNANAVNQSQNFGFAEDLDIKTIAYKDLNGKLTLKKKCIDHFNSYSEEPLNETYLDYEGVLNSTFFHTVYTGYNTISIPTSNGKGYISFVVE